MNIHFLFGFISRRCLHFSSKQSFLSPDLLLFDDGWWAARRAVHSFNFVKSRKITVASTWRGGSGTKENWSYSFYGYNFISSNEHDAELLAKNLSQNQKPKNMIIINKWNTLASFGCSDSGWKDFFGNPRKSWLCREHKKGYSHLGGSDL